MFYLTILRKCLTEDGLACGFDVDGAVCSVVLYVTPVVRTGSLQGVDYGPRKVPLGLIRLTCDWLRAQLLGGGGQ